MNQRRTGLFCAAFYTLSMAGFGVVPVTVARAEDDIQRIEIAIEQRAVADDARVVRVTQGDRLELVWTTDETVQLHLHGYDIELEVTPDVPAVMSLTAHATGRFPVTSHGFGGGHGHDTLLYLEVYPD
ncbi:MAG: hypothetical protein ACREVN_10560 [Gammaproteobacteria bacterium]